MMRLGIVKRQVNAVHLVLQKSKEAFKTVDQVRDAVKNEYSELKELTYQQTRFILQELLGHTYRKLGLRAPPVL